MYVVISVTGCC